MLTVSKKFNPELFSLKHLKRIIPERLDIIPDQTQFNEILHAAKRPRLLLEKYDESEIQRGLKYFGVLDKLAQEGFQDVRLSMDVSDPERARLSLFVDAGGQPNVLGEIDLHSARFALIDERSGHVSDRSQNMLYIQWLRLQNPFKSFTPRRPALPGQHFTGLKIGREVSRLLIYIAEDCGMGGIINLPEFLHAAIIYSWRFRYVSPEAEGLLQALMRDLKGCSLAEASWGMHIGCIKDTASLKTPLWPKEEQVLPLSREWMQYFESREYVDRMHDALDSHHFFFDRDEWQTHCPLKPDGSPVENT